MPAESAVEIVVGVAAAWGVRGWLMAGMIGDLGTESQMRAWGLRYWLRGIITAHLPKYSR